MSENNRSYGGKANFGKPQFENSRPTLYKFGKDCTELIMRIAPPCRDQRDNEFGWAKQYNQHWGYHLSVTKKDGTPAKVPMPFKCVRKYQNGEICQECAECVEVYRRKDELEALKAKYTTEGKSADERKALLESQEKWLMNHTIDKKFWMYAKNQDGKWGFLLVTKTLKESLDKCLGDLAAEGLDPIGEDAGVWLKFTRTDSKGKGDSVVPVVVPVPGTKYTEKKTDTMGQADWDQIEKLPPLFNAVRIIGADDVRNLVESKGDEEISTLIFSKGQPTFKPRNSRKDDEVSPMPVEAPPSPPEVKAAPVAAVAPAPATPVGAGSTLPAGMSVEDFMRSFGIKVG